MNIETLLQSLGISAADFHSHAAHSLTARTPIDGSELGHVTVTSIHDVDACILHAHELQQRWRLVPAPRRGELIRLFGNELRARKSALGELVSIETGKIRSEGLGEVQEMIDICDFAVGLSRQLHGLTIASERPGHRMMEQWHPLGVVGVISAFNFPVAVWSWNAMLALVCGNAVVWKPSEKTPLCALAVQALWRSACAQHHPQWTDLSQLLIGDAQIGEALAKHRQIELLSATGSTRMGRAVAPMVAARLGRYLLELGGNNAIIVAPSANLALALRAILFGAVGTAGQRCTSTRRLFIHEQIYPALLPKLCSAYERVRIGNPLQADTLLGPLIDKEAYQQMQAALQLAIEQGGNVHGGERVLIERHPDAWYVQPALVEMPEQSMVVQHETFAPILYVMRYRQLEHAMALHNAVPQGLSSALFTTDLREAEYFMSVGGSDCGIANINIGTSGAEIGGAFGGEKDTGGGRESGSDAWKNYMRRTTNTINYSNDLPLAQGVSFDL